MQRRNLKRKTDMRERIVKLAIRFIAGLNASNFEKVVGWVVDAGRNEALKTGLEEANEVVAKYNSEFAEKASYVVRTVVQIAYFIARVRGLKT